MSQAAAQPATGRETGTAPSLLPALPGFVPRLHAGVIEFPVHHMRGGTSTGLVLWEGFMPQAPDLREELLRHLMGVPHRGTLPGNRQITGLGRGPATSNKVFLADIERVDLDYASAAQPACSGELAGSGVLCSANAFQGADDASKANGSSGLNHPGGQRGPGGSALRLVSTLAQLASDHGNIDWSVNCGNMSAALPLWAQDTGLLPCPAALAGSQAPTAFDMDIRNTNTGVITTARTLQHADGRYALARIPGVDGEFPGVDLFLHDPVGAKTGRLMPTGAVMDVIQGHHVSCVDVAVPMVIADAAEFGKTAHEPIRDLETDTDFMQALRAVWIEAGLRMGLKRRDGQPMTREDLQRSETIPKACIVGAPRAGGQIAVRYFTPQTGHASMAVSGGCCLAAACLIPGSTAHRIAQGVTMPGSHYAESQVGIENPAGILEATIVARQDADGIDIRSAAYRRSAQLLLRGHMPLYQASPALHTALSHIAARQGNVPASR